MERMNISEAWMNRREGKGSEAAEQMVCTKWWKSLNVHSFQELQKHEKHIEHMVRLALASGLFLINGPPSACEDGGRALGDSDRPEKNNLGPFSSAMSSSSIAGLGANQLVSYQQKVY